MTGLLSPWVTATSRSTSVGQSTRRLKPTTVNRGRPDPSAMDSLFPSSRAAFLAFVLTGPMMHAAAPDPRVVDLRYGIPTWHQPLGVPDDWHKPMANERGALLYDFGPGPYVEPSTTVEATAE